MSDTRSNDDTYDVVVYGATAGGVAAAVAAARAGARVGLADPTDHVGGMVSGGLTRSDVERQQHVIGGIALEFFRSMGERYSDEHEWRFEPHVAEAMLRAWIDEHTIDHLPSWQLATADLDGGRIRRIVADDGRALSATCFIDASYEGDLLATAGVAYDVGRDGRDRYGESLAGRVEMLPNPHQFAVPVSALAPDGGLLPYVQAYDDIGPTGNGDGKLQSYCYRVCLTDDPDLRVDIAPPDGYDPDDFLMVRRYLDALGDDATLRSFMGIGAVPNAKHDINSGGPVSTSLLGGSWDHPEADPTRRREIEREHRRWAQGLLYFLGNDPSSPGRVRREMGAFGLPGDEFVATDHWPPQLYVRDSRRMMGEHVLTQHDLQGRTGAMDDAVGMGGYNIDIREVEWVAAPVYRFPDIFPELMTEGYVSVPVDPYPIPYRSLLPRREDCTNLLVSTCVSSSHVAFASFRMESQFMIAGHAAGVAAALAGEDGGMVHDVEVADLQRRLREGGQILQAPPG